MSEFQSEFEERLQSELGASESEARRIAEQARRFREDLDREDSAESLIERMKKRTQESPVGKWNTVVASLDADYWNIKEPKKGENPYKVRL